MEGVEEDEEETRRIYSLDTIDFVAKLDKKIYYGDAFGPDNFDSIVKDLPQLLYLLWETWTSLAIYNGLGRSRLS
jgi:hypothetical protein